MRDPTPPSTGVEMFRAPLQAKRKPDLERISAFQGHRRASLDHDPDFLDEELVVSRRRLR